MIKSGQSMGFLKNHRNGREGLELEYLAREGLRPFPGEILSLAAVVLFSFYDMAHHS